MLTLMRRGGFRFYVKSGSAQEKPHIFVTRDGDTWAKFTLQPVGVVVNSGFARNELTRLQGMVADLEPQLLQLWWEYASTQGVKPEAEKSDKHGHKPGPSDESRAPLEPTPEPTALEAVV
ncbi:MAG: DUF4160 domain-containing protein [Meiothermus sp.]|uniref:DUF4160 domain-containing protein n=1 Tax=Meiothermus sp. TaxID=1955249 RepID=UPI0025DB0A08|nr:DUF4160 domain-containing protein [Meiothermus sp.]MCS7067784.1 DUF4160 domain-containing protein [Meiothermus sp.]MDW8425249.1 DUF4160 domain-containing protein [Meiothermus sp.]